MRIVDDEEIFGIEDIKYEEEPNCEHCGDLEPFTAIVDTDPRYCLDCFSDLELSEDDLKQIEIEETKAKINYFKERLEGLEDYMKVLVTK